MLQVWRCHVPVLNVIHTRTLLCFEHATEATREAYTARAFRPPEDVSLLFSASVGGQRLGLPIQAVPVLNVNIKMYLQNIVSLYCQGSQAGARLAKESFVGLWIQKQF